MSYLAACLTVVVAVIAAAAASWVIGRTLSVSARARQHEVGSPVFLQVGVMLSVLLAFVFSETWGQYNTAAESINGECGALHGAAMLAGALPAGQGAPLTRAIATYAGTVVNTEWPMMGRGLESPRAVEEIRGVLQLASHLNVTQPVEVSNQSQILALLTVAHADRETRIFQMTQGLPAAMWTVLVAISLVLIGFVLFAGLERPGHMVLAGAFTGCTVLVLVLMKMLDYPFQGALALGDDDFVKMLRQVSAIAAGG
jgi:hypothetical protein